MLYEEEWADGTRIVPVRMETDRTKKGFRQRLEEAYETLLDMDVISHHISRLYFLPFANCANHAKFLASQDRLIAQGISKGFLKKEIWDQLYFERKQYLEKCARVVEWSPLLRRANTPLEGKSKSKAKPKAQIKKKTAPRS